MTPAALLVVLACRAAAGGADHEWRPDPATWTAQPDLPVAISRHRAVAAGPALLTTGGRDRLGKVQALVFAAPLSRAGAVGPWVREPDLPYGVSDHGFTAVGDAVILTGGLQSARGGERPSAQVWSAVPGRAGAVDTWTAGAALPAPLYGHAQALVGGHLYVCGGMGPAGARADVLVAEPGPGGRIGAWRPVLPLPAPLAFASAVGVDRYLVVIGGQSPGEGKTLVLPTVYVAPVNEDGSLTTWYLASSKLPGAWLGFGRSQTSAVAYRDGILCFGGQDALWFLTDSVVVAPLDLKRGELGAWAVASTGTGGFQETAAVVRDGFVYLVGGVLGGETTAKVRRAALVRTDREVTE